MTDSQNKETNSYKSILKGFSVFGSVQIFLILINLVRGKFVALILGPAGMGISSLFTTSSNTITKAFSLGLNLAIVKEAAAESDQKSKLSEVLASAKFLSKATALCGALFCILFSGWLSKITFHSQGYSWQFILLAVAVFFTIYGNGKLSVLQGLHKVSKLSKASLVGAITGLCAGIPLYYVWGDKGIVPAIVVLSLGMYIFYTYCLRGESKPEIFKWKKHKGIVKKLLSLGIILYAGDLIGTFCTYLLNIYLRSEGSLDTVGLYQAANSITNQYAGALFAALSLDYFPRLAKASHDNSAMNRIVNRQSEIVAIAIAPIASMVILTAPIIIRILLSEEFLSIQSLIRWMGFGVMLRSLQFPMGYIAFAKDNKRLFFILEGIITNVLYLGGSVVFFHFFGLIGLGYAMVAESLISICIYSIVNYRKYGYKFDFKVKKEYLLCVGLCSLCFCATLITHIYLSLSAMVVITSVSVVYSVIRLRKLLKSPENQ